MSVNVLKSLGNLFERIMCKDSIMLLWCSGKSMPLVLELLTSWNYSFVNILLVWVKLAKTATPKLGLGYWTRNNCELLLIAKKGSHAIFRGPNRDIG